VKGTMEEDKGIEKEKESKRNKSDKTKRRRKG
jgi:hypothetical protein